MSKTAILIIVILVLFSAGASIYILTSNNKSTQQQTASQKTAEAKEAAALVKPTGNVTPEEKEAYQGLVAEVAVEGNLIDITGCNPNPKVLKIPYKDAFAVKNDDSTTHDFEIEDFKFTIPAQNSTALTAGFGFKQGPGIYTYTCDGSEAVGALYITLGTS